MSTEDRETPGKGRGETPEERSDRNWNELLQELRVTQTGAQILTGFLLTLPFQPAFQDLDQVQTAVYLVLVVLAALTTALVLVPVSAHRLLFQQRRKPELVRMGQRAALGGLATLAVVLALTLFLVFDVVVGRGAAVVTGGVALVVLVIAWAALPIAYGRRQRERRA